MPIHVNSSRGAIFVLYEVRCRKCPPCCRARQRFWTAAASYQTRLTEMEGLRSWFGTLTISPAWQEEFAQRAYELWAANPDGRPNWDNVQCDERFRAVRDVILGEVQKYWKRLRKRGHRFKYFLVFERHKSGLPHMHFILHEVNGPIRKRTLQEAWQYGFTNVSIIGGKSRKAASPEKAAYYVAKYLNKASTGARQIASFRYKPQQRPKT